MLLNMQMTDKAISKSVKSNAMNMPRDIDAPEKDYNILLSNVGKNKDKSSFIDLFQHFAPRIKSFLIKGGISPEIADELAQETMLTIWNKAETYKPEQAAASTWIFTIARNKKIDLLRKTKRYEINPADPLLIKDSSPGPNQNIIVKQESEILHKALSKLPEEQASLVKKSFLEEKSHATIAQETGIPLGTIKSRIRLALDRLRHQQKIKNIGSMEGIS